MMTNIAVLSRQKVTKVSLLMPGTCKAGITQLGQKNPYPCQLHRGHVGEADYTAVSMLLVRLLCAYNAYHTRCFSGLARLRSINLERGGTNGYGYIIG